MQNLLLLADVAKLKSCDKHTKLGAVVTDLQGNVLIDSCNTIPDGLVITDERLERPTKYQFIEHAERNACFYAAKHGIKLEGTIMIMSCNPVPCTECARAIIQSGIKMVVGKDIENVASKKWDDSCNFALELLKEAGVIVVFVNELGQFNIVGNLTDEYRQFLG
jgi:dCMP deaminase